MTKFDALILAVEALDSQSEDPELRTIMKEAILILEELATEITENA